MLPQFRSPWTRSANMVCVVGLYLPVALTESFSSSSNGQRSVRYGQSHSLSWLLFLFVIYLCTSRQNSGHDFKLCHDHFMSNILSGSSFTGHPMSIFWLLTTSRVWTINIRVQYSFCGVFAELRKATLTFTLVHWAVCKNSSPCEGIVVKIYVGIISVWRTQ